MSHATKPSVAVIGGGVSGLTAAWFLRDTHDVTLVEADTRLGGHAHTHSVTGSDGRVRRVDSGFIVHNSRTYPTLLRLFAELGIATQPTEMSMSISCGGCGLSYAGGKGLGGILASPRRLADSRFRGLLAEVPRFHRQARGLLAAPDADGGPMTWGEFLAQGRFSRYFVQHFAIPLVGCVWSCGDEDARRYPARHLFTFLDNHGMLSVGGSPTWRTVTGGSATYVDTLVAALPDVRTGTPVRSISRHSDGVDVVIGEAAQRFDHVVVATHADDALRILSDATPAERADLGAIRYSRNPTVLHRDDRVLPTGRARASWNYRLPSCAATPASVQVSYWMNRLQHLDAPEDYIVSLAPPHPRDGGPAPESVIASMAYRHPVFTTEAVEAAGRLRGAGGPRLAFAGAHLGWGFHEDGARSGVEAARRLGDTARATGPTGLAGARS